MLVCDQWHICCATWGPFQKEGLMKILRVSQPWHEGNFSVPQSQFSLSLSQLSRDHSPEGFASTNPESSPLLSWSLQTKGSGGHGVSRNLHPQRIIRPSLDVLSFHEGNNVIRMGQESTSLQESRHDSPDTDPSRLADYKSGHLPFKGH